MWRPVTVLKPKEYSYLPDLIVKIFDKRVAVPGPVTQRLGLSADDPRNIAPNIAVTAQPPMEQLLQSHQSRFSN